MRRTNLERAVPPPIPPDARKKMPHSEDETMIILTEDDLLPFDEPTPQGETAGDEQGAMWQDVLMDTGLAENDKRPAEHVWSIHEAETQLREQPPQAEVKFVKIGDKVIAFPLEPKIVIASEKENRQNSVALKLETLAAKFGNPNESNEQQNEQFAARIDQLATEIASDSTALDELKKIIDIQSSSKDGAPLLYSAAGKKAFASLGSKLFERDPRAFAKKFGTGHQLFSPRSERIGTVTKLARESTKGAAKETEDLLVNGVILPDEVLGVLYRLDGDTAAELEKIIAEAEVGPLVEVRKRLEFLKGYEAIRDRMSNAIKAEMPELAEFEQQRRNNERELNQKEVRTTPIGSGVTAPMYVITEGMDNVYKPALHEASNENGDGTGGKHFRLSLRKDETLGAEAMASFIGTLSGMKNIPETVLSNGSCGIGSRQRWVDGKSSARTFSQWVKPDGIKPEYQLSIEDIVALDVLINNSDRHLNNVMIDETTKTAFPIDHGLSQVDKTINPEEALTDFCAERGTRVADLDKQTRQAYLKEISDRLWNDDLMSYPQYFVQNQPINADLLRRLTKLKEVLDGEGQVKKALRDMYGQLFKEEGKGNRLLDNFEKRLAGLVGAGKFPPVSTLFKMKRQRSLEAKIEKLKQNKPFKKLVADD
ncbi:MAG: hypothetical protein V1738_04075 [Patescibacteria group bacterium]